MKSCIGLQFGQKILSHIFASATDSHAAQEEGELNGIRHRENAT